MIPCLVFDTRRVKNQRHSAKMEMNSKPRQLKTSPYSEHS